MVKQDKHKKLASKRWLSKQPKSDLSQPPPQFSSEEEEEEDENSKFRKRNVKPNSFRYQDDDEVDPDFDEETAQLESLIKTNDNAYDHKQHFKFGDEKNWESNTKKSMQTLQNGFLQIDFDSLSKSLSLLDIDERIGIHDWELGSLGESFLKTKEKSTKPSSIIQKMKIISTAPQTSKKNDVQQYSKFNVKVSPESLPLQKPKILNSDLSIKKTSRIEEKDGTNPVVPPSSASKKVEDLEDWLDDLLG